MTIPEVPFLDSAAAARLEQEVCSRLAAFFSFGSHACYFTRHSPPAPEWLPGENRLLLPLLRRRDSSLVLRLDSVCSDLFHVLPFLEPILGLCLENSSLTEAMRRDPETGLQDETAFLRQAAARIEAFRNGTDLRSFGLLTFSWALVPEQAAESDAFAQAMRKLAEIFRKGLPSGAFGAAIGVISGNPGFGILCEAQGRGACQRLAREMLEDFGQVVLRDGFTHELKPVQFAAGHALYPNDISGRELLRSAFGQAMLLRDRALLAGQLAWQRGEEPCMAWGWIPAQAGMVEESLGHGVLRISPGQAANIQVGQRYEVLGAKGSTRALIVIREARKDDALAEILHVASASSQPAPGDRLRLDTSVQPAWGDGLPDRAWFFRRFAELSARAKQFCLAITRFSPGSASEAFGASLSGFLKACTGGLFQGVTIGSYGCDAIISYLPEQAGCLPLFTRLHADARAAGLSAVTGIFAYPCLNLGREESESCALKALDYAALLPEPHIGFLDGLALAISGDKLFSQGEELEALDEYRKALLLRPDDAAILNALGVCLGSLHRHAEAEARFTEALGKCQDERLKSKICYNLGNLSQKAGDLSQARAHYRACIRLDPGHIYAWTRLAQTASLAGRAKASISLYHHAARLAKNSPEALGMIHRHLARVEAGRCQTERAREILHDSLLRNPEDQASLLELAKTYIRDDPCLAESLARKCGNLGLRANEILIQALFAQGRHEDAARLADGRA